MSYSPKKFDFNQFQRDIASELDVVAEYEELGLKVRDNKEPNQKGYVGCWPKGRQTKDPSAWVNVETGRYGDMGGDGESLGLLDFAVKYGPHKEWWDALKHYAKKAGLTQRLPKNRRERPEDKLEFYDSPAPIRILCKRLIESKTGISAESIRLCGAKTAYYPKASPTGQSVIAFPIFSVKLFDADPNGWVMMRTDGEKVRIYQGSEAPDRHEKAPTVKGSKSGLMGWNGVSKLHEDHIEIVWKVEGITDLLAMQEFIPKEYREKHIVVTNSSGAREVETPKNFCHHFAGKHVAIIHDVGDEDNAGQDGAKTWVNYLHPVAESVRNIILPTGPSGKIDFRDWANQGHSYLDLLDIHDLTNPVTDETAISDDVNMADQTGQALNDHEFYLKKIDLIVIGQISGGHKIRVYGPKIGKVSDIPAIDRMKIENLCTFCGEHVYEFVSESSEDPDRISMKAIKKAIAAISSRKPPIDKEDEIGMGCYEFSGRILVIGHGESLIVNGDIQKTDVPWYAGKYIRSDICPEWYDTEELKRHFESAGKPDWCQAVLKESIELFKRWDNWKYPSNPDLITGLILASWVQEVWDWRPQIVVTGPTNSGKSMLIEENRCLHGIFGKLAMPVEKPTMAGLIQAVKGTEKVMLIDEFENDSKGHRKSIFEVFRTSSRGGHMVKGTADQKGVRYGLKHIPWWGAIETGMNRAADRNRCIFLELEKIPVGRGVKLQLPSTEELNELGMRLLAISLQHWTVVKKIAAGLVKIPIPDVNHRVIESFALPAAMLSVPINGSDTIKATQTLQRLLKGRPLDSQGEADESRLLADIYQALVYHKGRQHTISSLLSKRPPLDLDVPSNELLALYGIKMVAKHRDKPERVFFLPEMVSSNLLSRTKSAFNGADLSQILERAPGAERSRQWLSGQKQSGIVISRDELDELMGANLPGDDLYSDNSPDEGDDEF